MSEAERERLNAAILECAKTYKSIGKEEYAKGFFGELAEKYLYEGKSLAFVIDIIKAAHNIEDSQGASNTVRGVPDGVRLVNEALDAILSDEKVYKRLRYTEALIKIGQKPSMKQMELLMESVMPYLEAVKLDVYFETHETALIEFMTFARHKAWESGSLEQNFKVLKVARENTK